MVKRSGSLLAMLCLAAAIGGPGSMSRSARAGELISLYGGERVGSSAGQFLRVPTGARSIAMGGGMSAAVDGGDAPFWNPAGMITVKSTHHVFVSHTEYAADMDVGHIAYTHRNGPWRYAIFGGMLRSGDILRTDELHPEGQGFTFRADQFLGGISVGRQLTDRFTVAASGKFLQENLDEHKMQGFLIDFGALYYIGFKTARIGFAVLNFGGDFKLDGEPDDPTINSWQSYGAPTVANFGAAYDLGSPETVRMTALFEFRHPSDEDEAIILGGELSMLRVLQLRGGYRTNVEDGGISAGFGLRLGGEKIDFRAAYAYEDHGGFGGLHTISLELGR